MIPPPICHLAPAPEQLLLATSVELEPPRGSTLMQPQFSRIPVLAVMVMPEPCTGRAVPEISTKMLAEIVTLVSLVESETLPIHMPRVASALLGSTAMPTFWMALFRYLLPLLWTATKAAPALATF